MARTMSMLARPSLLAVVALIVAALALAACSGAGAPAASPSSGGGETPTGTASSGDGSAVGSRVGDIAPDFTVTTIDGETVSLAATVQAGTPIVVYYFASWCPTCRAELQSLKDVYPDYQDEVAFVAVDIDPSEDAQLIRSYKEQQGYPWPMAELHRGMLVDYRVTTQATKVVIDANGRIMFRAGYGVLSPEQWRAVLDRASGRAA